MRTRRSLCTLLALILLIAALPVVTSCGNDNKNLQTTPALSLNHKQLNLTVGDSIKLIPTVVGAEDTYLKFSSSLPSVAEVDSEGRVTAIAAGSTVITCTTKDGKLSDFCTVIVSDEGGEVVNPPIITPILTLDKTALTLGIGKTHQLVPTLILPEGADTTLRYSSNNPVIATVDENGLVTAVAPGTASIIVKTADGTLQKTCVVTVNGNGGRHVTLDFTSAVMMVGATKKLTATYNTAISGDELTLYYSSSLPSVASVDRDGVITAKGIGIAVITVTNFNGTADATCTITVKEAPKADLRLDKTELDLMVGDTYTLTPTYTPVFDTDSKKLTFTSSLEAVVSVDQNGKITAKGVGSGVITVSNTDGTAKATCRVNVTEAPKASLTLDVERLSLDEGATRTLKATYVPARETDSKELIYTTSNSAIAKIDQTGKITAVSAGQATITVTNKEGTVSASCKVDVIANSGIEASLTLDIYTLSLVVGESKTIHTSYTPSSSADTKVLKFSSSDTSVATVDQNGKIVAKAAGTATITVTNQSESIKAECKVTIKPAPVKPEDEDIVKSGTFRTSTGVSLNLLVEWNLARDEFTGNYVLTASVYLECYSIICGKRTGSSSLTIDGNKFSFNTEALNYSGVKEKQKIFFATASVVYKPDELPETVVIEAIWAFNGKYSGVSIPVLHPQDKISLK